MTRKSHSRLGTKHHESDDCGRWVNTLLIVGLVIFAPLVGALGWAWLAFDEEAFEAATYPPSIILEFPPPPEISEEHEGDNLASVDEEEGVANTDEKDFGENKDIAKLDISSVDDAETTLLVDDDAETAPSHLLLPEEKDVALTSISQENLVVEGVGAPLPDINPGGPRAWELYSQPFTLNNPNIPKVAVVIAGLGLSQAATETAIQQLPGAVTLAFAPYAHNLEGWIAQARAAGHEVLLELPMEPLNYPHNDPGPHTLLTSLKSNENLMRLDWLLSRFNGYIGVTSIMGTKFTASTNSLEPVLIELNDRGLLYLDSKASQKSVAGKITAELKMPSVASNRVIDNTASRVAIDTCLHELEQIAKSAGFAVGIGFPFPVTIERVSEWARALRHKRYALAPLSAMIARPSE